MKRMVKIPLLSLLMVIVVLAAVAGYMLHRAGEMTASDDPLVWESDIRAFEEDDRENPKKPGGILFAGS